MVKNTVLYEGPSALDGEPIAVIATGIERRSSNAKTGAMVQVFIIRADVHPIEALKTGEDASICGGCRHRPDPAALAEGKIVRSCYVDVTKSVNSVFKAYRKGSYAKAMPHELAAIGAGRKVRLGAYGDPAAVPSWVWSEFCSKAAGVTGYTHQWRTVGREYAMWCMASCDTPEERLEAKSMGYRVFRVSLDADRMDREVICPASDEAGNKTNCASCLACGGNGAKTKADIVIRLHGTVATLKAAQSSMKEGETRA